MRHHQGELLVWGEGYPTPTPLPALAAVAQVAVGLDAVLAVQHDGTLWAWGCNDRGQLGIGDTAPRAAWERVAGVDEVIAVATSWFGSSLAVQAGGMVWGWGWNGLGQVPGTTDHLVLTPVRIAGLARVRSVTTGGEANNGGFSMALGQDGTVWAWGINYNDWWGLDSPRGYTSYSPTQIPGLTEVMAIAAGGFHNLALKDDGSLWQPVRRTGGSFAHTWQELLPPFGGVTIAVTEAHCLAVRQDGTVWAWSPLYGDEDAQGRHHGWLGTAPGVNHHVPQPVNGIENAVTVAAGGEDDGYRSFALTSDGCVWAWGANRNGYLGVGEAADPLTPVRVPRLDDIGLLVASPYLTLAVRV